MRLRLRVIGWLRWVREMADRGIVYLEGPTVHAMGVREDE